MQPGSILLQRKPQTFSRKRSDRKSPTSSTRPIYNIHIFRCLTAACFCLLCVRRRTTSVSGSCHSNREKQHLKSTPTLGSTLRTRIVSSEGFSEGKKRDSERQPLQVPVVSHGLKREDRGYFWTSGGEERGCLRWRGRKGGKL